MKQKILILTAALLFALVMGGGAGKGQSRKSRTRQCYGGTGYGLPELNAVCAGFVEIRFAGRA